MGENATRAISVYLPPGYDAGDQRYPVIYFLHGFSGDNTLLAPIAPLLDLAIATRRIRPFIMVIPDEKTTYDGSFYSNSGALAASLLRLSRFAVFGGIATDDEQAG